MPMNILRRPDRLIIRTLAIGAAWGVLCGIANGWPVASALVQMAVPWIWVAAYVGYALAAGSNRRGAALGVIALLAANLSYLVVEMISRGLAGQPLAVSLQFFFLWAIVGLIVGPIAGIVGVWLSAENYALVAVVALATITVAEPLALWAHIDHFDAHLAFLLVALAGLGFVLLWYRPPSARTVKAVALVIVLAYPIAVVLEAVLIALGQISPPMRLV
jgi:Family of unknown function (DUF6518)